MGNTLKIAAIQMDCTPAPVPDRLARAATLIAEAAGAGAQLIVFPELFNTGYEWHARNYALAEPLDGETVTWMKAQAAQHAVHLAGTMLLLDETDIYNAALLVAPEGRLWRYDKRYVPLWERAYSRGGDHITIADTRLGKLGMLICWDQHHPNLWAEYAGQVDAMLVMSCPGDVATGELIFPDGFRTGFMTLVGAPGDDNPPEAEADSAPGDDSHQHPYATWIGVPVVESSATGTVRTTLPLAECFFATSSLADRVSQAADMILECGFPPATQIVNANGQIVAQGTATGDGVVLSEVDIPDPVPSPVTPQPEINIPPEMYQISDEIVPALMLPLYREGVRRQWGAHMAPD